MGIVNLAMKVSESQHETYHIDSAKLTIPLSPLIRADIWRMLSELKRSGLSLIVIDKNLGTLLKLADRHYVLEKGCVVWHGTSEALRQCEDVVHQYLGM